MHKNEAGGVVGAIPQKVWIVIFCKVYSLRLPVGGYTPSPPKSAIRFKIIYENHEMFVAYIKPCIYVLGLSLLCQHNFEHNRVAKALSLMTA